MYVIFCTIYGKSVYMISLDISQLFQIQQTGLILDDTSICMFLILQNVNEI